MDYAATAHTTFGFQFNFNESRNKGDLGYNSGNYSGGQLDSTGSGSTGALNNRSNFGTNVNMVHQFGSSGRELSADLNYLNYSNKNDQSLQNLMNQPDGVLTGQSDFFYHMPSSIHIYTLKADYVHPLKNKAAITRRIDRPNYQLLNDFLVFHDQYSYTSGNSLLTPQYQNRYEIKYQYKQLLRMTLSYNRFNDLIFQTTRVADNIFITQPQNIGSGYMLLLNTGISLSPAKWWQLNSDVLLSRMGLNGNVVGVKLNPATYVARINIRNQYTIVNGWSAELDWLLCKQGFKRADVYFGDVCCRCGYSKENTT